MSIYREIVDQHDAGDLLCRIAGDLADAHNIVGLAGIHGSTKRQNHIPDVLDAIGRAEIGAKLLRTMYADYANKINDKKRLRVEALRREAECGAGPNGG